nr:MAG TPA: hypothetical protein [Caudoviricetes sp.]
MHDASYIFAYMIYDASCIVKGFALFFGKKVHCTVI